MYKLSIGIALGFLLFNSSAMAACSVPNTLTNGTTADATAVMGNFTSLAGCAAPLVSPSFSGALSVQNASATAAISITGISNASATVALQRSANVGTYSSQISFNTAGNPDFAMGTSQGIAANDAFSIYDYGNSANAFTILKASGYVGIATVSPSYQLHVNGTAYATGAAGALSDRRHKKDVASLGTGALDEVMQLRPVSFYWREPKDRGMQGPQMGFIAQEVERVIPTVVLTEDNAEKTKGLKYNELIALLTKAMQEQQAKIEELKGEQARQANTQTLGDTVRRQQTRITELEAANSNELTEIGSLKAQLGALQRRVNLQTAQR